MKPTTVRLTDEDLKAIRVIQEATGAQGVIGAIRFAIRQVAKNLRGGKRHA